MSTEKDTKGTKNIYPETAAELRRLRGPLEPKAFAGWLKVGIQTYYRYERGERKVPDSVLKLARIISKEGTYLKDRAEEHVTADAEGLWGKTERVESEGVEFTVTNYGEQKRGHLQGTVLGQAVDMLDTVLRSGDQVFIQALMSNLIAFSSAVRESKSQATRIAGLERRLAALEAKLKDNPGDEESKESAVG